MEPYSFPVPGYSFDWLVLWQKKEVLGGTLVLLAFIRSSVAGQGLGLYMGLEIKMVGGFLEGGGD